MKCIKKEGEGGGRRQAAGEEGRHTEKGVRESAMVGREGEETPHVGVAEPKG